MLSYRSKQEGLYRPIYANLNGEVLVGTQVSGKFNSVPLFIIISHTNVSLTEQLCVDGNVLQIGISIM